MTPRQLELLDFIKAYIAENRTSPSYREMCDAVGVKSKAGIHRLIKALLERGHIIQLEGRARSIQVVVDPSEGAELANSPLWMEIEKTFTDHENVKLSCAATIRILQEKISELNLLRS